MDVKPDRGIFEVLGAPAESAHLDFVIIGNRETEVEDLVLVSIDT